MPTSRPNHLAYLCNRIIELQPHRVLDVGVGFGKFGFLVREYTDIWNQRYLEKDWKTKIYGIEIFSDYITKIQTNVYDHIIIDNALDQIGRLGEFDLIYCGDMIEHLTKEDGFKLIELMKQHTKHIIIVTPVVVSEQGAVFNNENERHLSQWSYKDFPDAKVSYFHNTLFIEIGVI